MKLPKVYEPSKYESDIYAMWEQGGAFKPSGEGEPYSIVMPPPNANGDLHLGHGLMTAAEDILIRYHRMRGDDTIYIPGADHAGFETWVVYEKHLEKHRKSRFDFKREELYQQVWDFVAANRGNMEIQLRQMGASCDWDKLVFTLDETVVKTTHETFEKMWNEGLIYRGERLVNYCTQHQTSFADIEVTYEDRKTPLYYMKYGPFELATTRPETKFGDTAVAIHPDDKRYQKYIGKELEIEGVNGPFKVKVIADDMVDREFGTGVVKITPAHDFNDWEVAQRHNLPAVTVIDQQGKMTEAAGRFAGMTVLEAREAVVNALEEKGLLINVDEDYQNRVGVCYKCGTVIEPLLKDQWFVKVQSLAEKAIEAVKSGKIKFVPDNKGKVLVNYLKNLKDWNISRQIPWGIPIPAFQSADDPESWEFDTRVDQEEIEVKSKTYTRDPDTFDTWFSSSQWPYIVTKYHDSGELGRFFPNSVMETGADILYQWVARMIMMSLYREDKIPFETVYLHGLVMDPKGQKMSKSKGNVINPQEIMKEYGSDALRMGLVASRSAAQDQAFGKDKVIAGRNFANKLWNIARYVQEALGDKLTEADHPRPISAADHWVVREINDAKKQIASLLEEYRFAEAYEVVYHTIWDKVADWYIEASKGSQNVSTLLWVLEGCLVMSHPFAPFVTETIWQTLDWHNEEEDMLITTKWYMHENLNNTEAKKFDELQKIVKESREVAAEIGSSDIALLTVHSQLTLENADLIQRLAKLGYVQMTDEPTGLKLTTTKESVWLDLNDDQIATYRQRLSDKIEKLIATIERLQKRLENKSYVENAPEALVEETRAELEHQTEQLKHLSKQFKKLH